MLSSNNEKSRKRVVYHLRDFVALDALGLRFSPDFNPFNPHPLVFVWQFTLPQGLERDTEVFTAVGFVYGCDAAEVCPAACLLKGDAYCC